MSDPNPVHVLVNGQTRRLDPSTALATLVDDLTARTGGVAVAVNGTVVPRGRWTETPLRDGDAVEVVTAVQGG